jgi:hypothetical protein
MFCLECDLLGGAIITASQYAPNDNKSARVAETASRLRQHRLADHGHDSLYCQIGTEKRFAYVASLSIYTGLVNSGEEGVVLNAASDRLLRTQEEMTDHYKKCKCPESNPAYSPAVIDL